MTENILSQFPPKRTRAVKDMIILRKYKQKGKSHEHDSLDGYIPMFLFSS